MTSDLNMINDAPEFAEAAGERICCRIAAEDDGKPLSEVLRQRLGVSRGFLRRLARRGMALANGQPCRLNDLAHAGDCVLLIPGHRAGGMKPEEIPLDVVYADDDLLVVNKPAGMVAHPARRHVGGTLANAVAYYLAPQAEAVRVHPVHRLDAGTSGLIVFAKHEHAHAVLSRDMAQGRFRRWYTALAAGRMQPLPAGEWRRIEAPIGRTPGHPVKREVSPAGQAAVTLCRVMQAWDDASLLELELLTGRTHQARVHLAHIGHPLIGDELYGGPPLLARPALHSAQLECRQPLTRKPLLLTAELPSDMSLLIKALAG